MKLAPTRKGSAAVTAALGTLEFPITKEEAISRIGSWEVPAGDSRVELADLIRGVPAERFRDVRAATAAVDHRYDRLARNLEAVEDAERRARERPR